MSSSASDLSSDRRGQLTTPHSVRLLVGAVIGLVVLALVVNEMLSLAVSVEAPITTCGLCHVEWWRPLGIFAVASGLTAVAHWLVGGPKQPAEGDDE